MRTQLSLCGSLLREEVIPVENSEESAHIKKPKRDTGLWTSEWREDTQDSGWVAYLVDGDYGDPSARYWYLLAPCASAKLYTVNAAADLHLLLQQYRWNTLSQGRAHSLYLDYFRRIDFERLAQDYDGLHLTWRGYNSTRGNCHNLDAWSCESTCWFRWKFESAQLLRTPTKEMAEVPMD